MAILFAQYWDVVEDKDRQYEEFILGTHIPSLEKTGLRVVGGYYVVIGAGPRIVGISTTENLQEFQNMVTSKEYTIVMERLFPLIRNYSSKLLVSYGPVKVKRYEVQLGVWKFNQYFNVIPGMEQAYREFVKNDFIPRLEQVGLEVTNIWKVVIGSGPFILVELSSHSMEEIARSVDTDEYRAVMRTAKSKYIHDYQSRILAPTRRVEVPYFIKGLTAGL